MQEEHAKLFQQQEIKAMYEDLEDKLLKEEERIEHEDDEMKRIELENLEKEMVSQFLTLVPLINFHPFFELKKNEEKANLDRNPRYQELSKENAQLKV